MLGVLGLAAGRGRRGAVECAADVWESAGMDRERVISMLRAHEQELKSAGIVRLSVFGSVARGEASERSDVDLMAEFDSSKKLSLLDMVGLENRLADILGAPVDL